MCLTRYAIFQGHLVKWWSFAQDSADMDSCPISRGHVPVHAYMEYVRDEHKLCAQYTERCLLIDGWSLQYAGPRW